ncbi:MAG: YihA family ribosome biogenesis GTP-binding protein [Sulfurimonas sp. RIFCSPHIGHO2_12_FULL_36_9]|jgi:GTP-binding protein|uniref:ribosome biogenesis GTP-binding protein YihA/YsxC n=1 Tax=unclassified Sulfurimonas TaxID=2623549 RepID=UPI0008CD9931|nr:MULTISPECIES: ribosome biogenesis GTP-binding protein YihA/YsxC [unclassified Sulfurimonas]OHD97921.1 MAG: YihA family ribosome biogenesis GTP-binding protein [Sulfurimonas sp. RIFCSPHIGHO2_12_FULL_36_9]OHE00843.1 MAG: YihA family ribosome biogenesis GTP-binding protein [Sulfurimonas sp. RIFCSPLOWO2_02_FULL_36_28]OHE01841.1 MAG: YihA family ribosome biogenesis GTP-binding protein [Sulfurimonas sp. RIFCSPLOWO2_12_36_12]OHE07824.1 MAG: YihA family ribosome biogenesis GTP-binding protein [Sulfu
MIEIVDAKFVTSAANIAGAPDTDEQNEVVFMARSNVGKSSLLNALTNHKGLAKVSSTPGKTRLINYFDVTFIDRDEAKKSFAKFVDLPGFGYAKVSKSIKYDWERNLTDYISSRKQIKLFIHLIDSRHPFLEIDKSVIDFLLECSDETQHILQIFTKIDKLNQKEQDALRREFPKALMVSSSKKKGLEKVVTIIHNILKESPDEC